MSKKITQETKDKIKKLFDNGNGSSTSEIAKQTGISYKIVYDMTVSRQRINPETSKTFESRKEYNKYRSNQRVDLEPKNHPNLKSILDKGFEKNRKLASGEYILYVKGRKRITYDHQEDEIINRYNLDDFFNAKKT